MLITRWWSERSAVERFDLTTRWPLYLVSASEPAVALLLIVGEPEVRAWGGTVLLLVALTHTAACLSLLRTCIARALGEDRRLSPRLIALTLALTAAGVAAGYAAFPTFGRGLAPEGFPVGLAVVILFCAATTVAVTPALREWEVLAVVGVPTIVAGVVQAVTGNGGQTSWAVNYALCVGMAVFTYRSTAWILNLVWEIDRSRDAQAQLAVAEERLRFARDLHDVLGRNLALIAVNSELAAHLAGSARDEAVERMLQTRQIAQDSMREMREVVAGRRTADLDAELAGARSMLRSAGVNTRVIGDGGGLSPRAQAGFGWVVREATTNIIRHSEATLAKIEITVASEVPTGTVALLTVENDGVRLPPPGQGQGTGLVGLRERLAELGGAVETESLPGSRFRLRARLPLTDESSTTELAAERIP